MPFDPTLPVDDSLAQADELRAQFNSLKALLDAQAVQIADLQTQVNAAQQTADDIQSQLADYVQHTELNNQIVTQSAANVDGVSPVNGSVGNPPTQAQVTAIADRLDELINGLHRTPP